MDRIIFHHDTVLSDIHLLLPNTRHLMTRLNRAGQPVFMSRFRLLTGGGRGGEEGGGRGGEEEEEKKEEKKEEEEKEEEEKEEKKEEEEKEEEEKLGQKTEGDVASLLDEDGDFNVTHRAKTPPEGNSREVVCPVILQRWEEEEEEEEEEGGEDEDGVIRIEHTMATPLEDVGKQVWRGAFLMADFILSEPLTFAGATVLELGAGTGFTSITMATVAKTVYCTDVGDDLLSMCRSNVALNSRMMKAAGGEVKVRLLDWLQQDLCTDADVDFSWTEDEVADLHDNTSFIIAADLCYDDELTDGLFRTLHRLCTNFNHRCTVLIAMEKRMNFTLRHMDVSCDAYDHFIHRLLQLQRLDDGRCSFRVEQLPASFAQFLLYERIEQLELWRVTSTPL